MRIAYVSLHWPRLRNSGVGKKIHSQVTTWRRMGHEVRLFMHTHNHEPVSDLIDASFHFYSSSGKLSAEFSRIDAMRRMLRDVRDYSPDIIYLRYGIYVYPAHLLMKIAPVVEEINTNDLTQHEGLGRVHSLYNRFTRGIFLHQVRGLISVSQELADSPAFAVYRKPVKVIANGIGLKDFPALPPAQNTIPRLVFIGNPGNNWHGIDKLIALARLVPDIIVDIIGYDELPGFAPLPENVILHGYLSVEQYKNILARADVAISSLALHRIQLEEASPLKSRECLAFGLPLVVAYKDTDLDGLGCDFVLKIPNTEGNIQTHASAIREFAYRMRNVRVPQEALQVLDQDIKEMERLSFFQHVIGVWNDATN